MNDSLNYTETDEIKKLNHFGCALCAGLYCDSNGIKKCSVAIDTNIALMERCPATVAKGMIDMLKIPTCKIITVDTLKENQYTKEVH